MKAKRKLLSLCLALLIVVTQNSSLIYAKEVSAGQENVDFSVVLQRGDGTQEVLKEIQSNTVEINGKEQEVLQIQIEPSDGQNLYEYQFSNITNGEQISLKGPGT